MIIVVSSDELAAPNSSRRIGPQAVTEESVVSGAEIVHPLRLTVAAGSLLRLDHAAALRADLAGHVQGMIFPRGPVLLVEVDVGQPLRFRGGKYRRQVQVSIAGRLKTIVASLG